MKKIVLTSTLLLFIRFSDAQQMQGDGLNGHYYQGYSIVDGIINFDGLNKAYSRVDTLIDFWNGSAYYQWQPVSGYASNYSVQWQGFIYIDEPGAYGFGTISDDGSQIFIRDSMIVNNGEAQWYDWEDNISEGDSATQHFEPIVLEQGFHRINIRFYEKASYDGIEFWWIKPSEIDSSDHPWYGENFHNTPPVFNPETNWELVPKQVLFTEYNYPPVAVTDHISVSEDSMLTFNPLLNDFDPDSNLVILEGYGLPANGTLEVDDIMFTYIPHNNYFGADSFHYFVSDSLNAVDTGLVMIQVNGQNDAPGAFTLVSPANGTILDSTTAEITFRWNASVDVDGDILEYDLHIFRTGQDTLIPAVEDSFFVFSGSAFFQPQSEYNWTVQVKDANTNVYADTFTFSTPSAVNIQTDILQPPRYTLSQNYPNPFNPETRITYTIAEKGRVTLKIFDIVGKEMATLVDNVQNAGRYTVTYKASSLPSGVYFYRLVSGDQTVSRKMMLVR